MIQPRVGKDSFYVQVEPRNVPRKRWTTVYQPFDTYKEAEDMARELLDVGRARVLRVSCSPYPVMERRP